jgi:hypothetical protein
MLAFTDIKTHRNGQIGKKGCRQKKGMSGKLADIDVSVQHVADMSPTFPTKSVDIYVVDVEYMTMDANSNFTSVPYVIHTAFSVS